MLTLFSRSSTVVAGIVLAASLGLATMTGIAVAGLNNTAAESDAINTDEVAHATLAAQFALAVDRAFVTGRTLALVEFNSSMSAELYQEQIPRVEALLVDLRRIETEDGGERERVARLVNGWTAMRALLTDPGLTSPENTELIEELRQQYETFNRDAEAMVRSEAADAGLRNQATSDAVDGVKWQLIGTAGLTLALLAGLGFVGNQRMRREIEPMKDQAEFADTLQLTETEEGAHGLLQRRLLRVVPDGAVAILNRNNSANRLEAMTDLSDDPALAERLEAAEPRSCLAIRSARAHDEDAREPGLITCDVCSPCAAFSTCRPLTVGGEVIGSVLVSTPHRADPRQRRMVRDSVAQAAPVLANLRNLAIAQLRASTDALTGLPNKRSVADNLKRMFAQSSRSANPMAVVMLDLDHFKSLNDRFGHPAGDQVLASVGTVMRATMREGDFAGRNGGEEFAVILPDTDAAGGAAVAEKLRKAIADVVVPGVDVEITASLGVAAYPEHALSPERLERLADAALYVAKRLGRNRVEVATGHPEPEDDQVTIHPASNGVASRDLATSS
ncbi:GGDEF domain-containing protein [Nocardioides sp.]|uniref:GGDEF domain-containing protein n=1 Tax=Nocardioides sp. TaxID=35761 RepID=UPI001A2B02A4|nr:GGDEF domain-containing protein [Nocardioides sp.]MBJ7355717.1 GGDEF domain-containing protein [Nocardioides sp.]